MSTYRNFQPIDNPLLKNDGTVWNRLHSQREDVCALLNKAWLGRGTIEDLRAIGVTEPYVPDQQHHRELLQSRLRQLDDALDRLMAGSYGNCSNCGRWIEDTRLFADPALAFCIECQHRAETRT
jgi:RNA polymerase-binding transcription factor